jgi:hypothetical protein
VSLAHFCLTLPFTSFQFPSTRFQSMCLLPISRLRERRRRRGVPITCRLPMVTSRSRWGLS